MGACEIYGGAVEDPKSGPTAQCQIVWDVSSSSPSSRPSSVLVFEATQHSGKDQSSPLAGYSRQLSATFASEESESEPEVTMTFHLGWQLSFRHPIPWLPFQRNNPLLKRTFGSRTTSSSRKFQRGPWIASAFLLSGVGLVSYDPPQQVAHTFHAVRRCSRVAEAVVPSAIDYKRTLWKDYDSEASRQVALSECHTRSANRVLRAMLANGGEIYIA